MVAKQLRILGECRSASNSMASFFLEVGISLAATTFDSTMIGQLAFFGGGSLAQINFGCRVERSQISSVLEDQVHRRMKALQGFLRHCPKKEPPLCLGGQATCGYLNALLLMLVP